MRVGWVLGLCACNAVYGLERTQLVDAPGPDAPPRCTTDGAPPFSLRVTQAVIQACSDYTIHDGLAVAACGTFVTPTLASGPIDGALAMLDITATHAGAELVAPRLTPDGELLVHQEARPARTAIASVYRFDQRWVWREDLPFALAPLERVGVPSRGPQRHVMVTRREHVEEAVDDGNGSWTTTQVPFAALGVTEVTGAIQLSADGLRAVFAARTDGIDEVRYAVRASTEAPFAGSYPLAAPAARDPFLTEDCSRLYFSGLDSIFFATQ